MSRLLKAVWFPRGHCAHLFLMQGDIFLSKDGLDAVSIAMLDEIDMRTVKRGRGGR